MKRVMHFVLLAVLALLLTGCLGAQKPRSLAAIEISPRHSVLEQSAHVVLTAVGRDSVGNTIVIEPSWNIVTGEGQLNPQGSSVTFVASGGSYLGDVLIEAVLGSVRSDPAVVTVVLDSTRFNPPTPNNINYEFANRTESVIEVGQPLDHYRGYRTVHRQKRYVRTIPYPPRWTDWTHCETLSVLIEYVRGGELLDPTASLPPLPTELFHEFRYVWDQEVDAVPLPEAPHLSWDYHYALMLQRAVSPNSYAEVTRTITTGTSTVEATAFSKSTSRTFSVGASWGWVEASASITETLQTTMSQTYEVSELQTVEEKFHIMNSKDSVNLLYAVWRRIDTFYVSDRDGIAVDASPVFPGRNLEHFPFTIESNSLHARTWNFPI